MPPGLTVNAATHETNARAAWTSRAIGFVSGTSFRARLLTGVWLLFAILVALGIHGSSIPLAAEWWAPESHYSGYVFGFIPNRFPESTRIDNLAMTELAMAHPRAVRSDEWLVTTPLALAQLSHRPRFPVVNTNIGDGQNMLINPAVPVWHPSLLARPITWGYFLLGGQRGLAWSWWFQALSCFTGVFLLLEIILGGRQWLAAFGAFWFCASAYVVCFSLMPAYYTAFATVICVAAYQLLGSNKPVVQLASGAVLGIALAGFLMLLYPPWQIPLGYLALFIFLSLAYRDRLYSKLWPISRSRALAILIALGIAAAVIAFFLGTCLPALKVMASTVYPGHRVSDAGTYKLRVFFRGMYNLISAYSAPAELGNQSEASSFYYFFPPILIAMALSSRFRSRVGVVGQALAVYILLLGLFAFTRVPEILAKFLLMSYAVPARTDIGFGLASILLSVIVLAGPNHAWGQPEGRTDSSTLSGVSMLSSQMSWERAVPGLASVAFALLIFGTGLMLSLVAGGFPPVSATMLVALVSGLASFCLLTGRRRIFCYLVAAAVIATSAFFNPLSTNLDYLYHSELAQAITDLSKNPDAIAADTSGGPRSGASLPQGQRPLWLSYGLAYPEVQVQVLGGRALPGIQWPPQLDLWRRLDPSGAYEHIYNRYAHIQLGVDGIGPGATFTSPKDDTITVTVPPTDPALLSMGARYVLAMYKYQANIDRLGLPVAYKSNSGAFTIYRIP
jgi:hypothetical protein